MPAPNPRRAVAGRANALKRHCGADAPETVEAHADLLDMKIRALVDAAPPLTPEQRARLAAIFTNPAPQPRKTARRR